MSAGQYLEIPDYSCLVTRLNYAELTGEDSIWENSLEWFCDEERLEDLACKANESKLRIKAPSGATIWFKAFDREQKKQKVKSESYDRIVNDEASELHPKVLQFEYRSLRSPKDSFLPLAMINLSNPGGDATDYICERYVDGPYNYYLMDWRHNIFINQKVYAKTLDNLDFIDQKYQKEGDWHYRPAKGELFQEEQLRKIIIPELPEVQFIRNLRGVDMAVTKKGDRTAFMKWYRDERGHSYIGDLVVEKTEYPEEILIELIEQDNPRWQEYQFETEYFLEREPGSSGEHQVRYIQRELSDYIDHGLDLYFTKPTTNKFTRARPMARAIKNNEVSIIKADWNETLIEEFKDFGPDDKEYEYDDIVDAGSIGFNNLPGVEPLKIYM